MATHSSVLAWRIPGMGSHRVGHDWSDLAVAVALSLERQWHPTPALLPGKSHGWRSLVGCSPWGRYESDMTERLHFHFSLSCIGEGNGNPLQCYCLENPRDRGAWWAAVCGVTQSQTWLQRLSSSSIPGYSLIFFLVVHDHWKEPMNSSGGERERGLRPYILNNSRKLGGNCINLNQNDFIESEE